MLSNRYNRFISEAKAWFSNKTRNCGWFSTSFAQLYAASEIQRINGQIARITDTQKCVLCSSKDSIEEIHSLLLNTDLRHKNVVSIFSDDMQGILENCGDLYRSIPVTSEQEVLKDVDFILLSDYRNRIRDELEFSQKGFADKIISIYDGDSLLPFGYKVDTKQLSRINRSFLLNNPNYVPTMPMSHVELSFLDNIRRVNDKIAQSCTPEDRILIYCAGGHTKALFNFTNIVYYNVIAIADRDRREYMATKTRNTEKASFEDVDKIIISSLAFQNEIFEYLKQIGQADKAVKLYNDNDKYEFYLDENIYAPDISVEIERSDKYQYGEINRELERCANDFTEASDYYINYSMTRLFGDSPQLTAADADINVLKGYEDANTETAIVIQGPIIHKHDFTFCALRQMRYAFPESTMILSTWEGEERKPGFERYKDILGIDVVLSRLPANRGLSNVNLQIESAYQGLIRAKELNKEYALKMRTDYLITNRSAISFLNSMVKRFPIRSTSGSRIAVMPCRFDLPWYIPDFINYGTIENMLEFWDNTPFSDINDGRNPEMLLYSRYAKAKGFYLKPPDIEMSEYFRTICDNFIVFDVSVLNAIWYKYTYRVDYFEQDMNMKINYHDWFNYVQKDKGCGESVHE